MVDLLELVVSSNMTSIRNRDRHALFLEGFRVQMTTQVTNTLTENLRLSSVLAEKFRDNTTDKATTAFCHTLHHSSFITLPVTLYNPSY